METEVVSSVGDFTYPSIICITFLLTLLLLKFLDALNAFLDPDPKGMFLSGLFFVMLQDIYSGFIISAHVILSIMMMRSIDTNSSYSLLCHPGHSSADDNRALIHIQYLMWLYYTLKILQLGSIVSLFMASGNILMLFHRISMVLMAWYAAKYVPGGTVIMWELLDCGIFLIVLLGRPSIFNLDDNPVSVLMLQLVNVIAMSSHILVLFNTLGIILTRCPFPPGIAEWVLMYMLVLFGLKCLQCFYYYDHQEDREFIDYYFWEPPFTGVIATAACVVFIPLLGLLAILYYPTIHS